MAPGHALASPLMSDEQLALGSAVRRDWAWPELVGLIVTGVGFVLALFL